MTNCDMYIMQDSSHPIPHAYIKKRKKGDGQKVDVKMYAFVSPAHLKTHFFYYNT